MPYSVKSFFEINEDMVQILLMLEVLFTISQNISECCKLSGHDFPTHHFVKSAGEVMVLVLCTSPDGALYLYQLQKYLRGF